MSRGIEELFHNREAPVRLVQGSTLIARHRVTISGPVQGTASNASCPNGNLDPLRVVVWSPSFQATAAMGFFGVDR